MLYDFVVAFNEPESVGLTTEVRVRANSIRVGSHYWEATDDEMGDVICRHATDGSSVVFGLEVPTPDLLEACRAVDLYADDLTGEYGPMMLEALRLMREAMGR